MEPLTIPAGHEEDIFVVSVSGGKDSTATWLRLRESNIPCIAVFADTGWEAPETYEYLDTLRRLVGPIEAVTSGGFATRAVKEGILPHGKTAWCTRELKVKPLRAFHERLREKYDRDTVSVVGVRAEESEERSRLAEFEFGQGGDREWDGLIWRPLLRATVHDVLTIHHRHNVPVNPLYRMGFSRVGCAPCRNANKEDIRRWADTHPARIDAVRDVEIAVNAERARRGLGGTATFFTSKTEGPVPIDRAVEWSRTVRGGKQLPLIQPPPSGGCFRWGFCDPPSPEGTDEASVATPERTEARDE